MDIFCMILSILSFKIIITNNFLNKYIGLTLKKNHRKNHITKFNF